MTGCNRIRRGGYCPSAFPLPVRLIAAVCLLSVAACAPPAEAPAPAALSGPVDGTSAALAARLGPGAVASAFERLGAVAYDARVVVQELDESSRPVGRFERTVRHAPGAPDRFLASRATGTLADTSDLDPARLMLRDPIPSVLPDTPAYLAPSTRDQYVVRVGQARGAVRGVEVSHLADTEQAVQRVVAVVDTASGAVLRMTVARSSRSAIYDEATRADVRLQNGPAGLIPAAVETTSIVSTPLGGIRTYRVTWRITPVQRAPGADAPAGTNTRNP